MHSTGSLCPLQKRQQQQQETAWRKASLTESVVKVRSLCLTFHRHLCRGNSPVCFQPRWLLAARLPALPHDCPAHEWSLPALGFMCALGGGQSRGRSCYPAASSRAWTTSRDQAAQVKASESCFLSFPLLDIHIIFFPSHGAAKLIVVYQLKHCQTSPGIPPSTALCGYSK